MILESVMAIVGGGMVISGVAISFNRRLGLVQVASTPVKEPEYKVDTRPDEIAAWTGNSPKTSVCVTRSGELEIAADVRKELATYMPEGNYYVTEFDVVTRRDGIAYWYAKGVVTL